MKKKGIEGKVGITEVELNKDNAGFYISYCMLDYHPGLISVGRAEICEQRKCNHYKRLYLNDGIGFKEEDFDK